MNVACPGCGSEIAEDFQYCPICGISLSGVPHRSREDLESQSQSAANPTRSPAAPASQGQNDGPDELGYIPLRFEPVPERRRKRRPAGAVVIALAVLIVTVVAAYALLRDDSNSEDDVPAANMETLEEENPAAASTPVATPMVGGDTSWLVIGDRDGASNATPEARSGTESSPVRQTNVVIASPSVDTGASSSAEATMGPIVATPARSVGAPILSTPVTPSTISTRVDLVPDSATPEVPASPAVDAASPVASPTALPTLPTETLQSEPTPTLQVLVPVGRFVVDREASGLETPVVGDGTGGIEMVPAESTLSSLIDAQEALD